MGEIDEAFREIVSHKASLMRGRTTELKEHIEGLLEHEDVAWDESAPLLVPAVDAMIFDVASALAMRNRTRQENRQALILEMWRRWREQPQG